MHNSCIKGLINADFSRFRCWTFPLFKGAESSYVLHVSVLVPPLVMGTVFAEFFTLLIRVLGVQLL